MKFMASKGVVAASLVSVLVLSGCTNGTVNKAQVGAVGGAVAGGVLGHQIGGGTGKTVATIAGTILGGYFGGMLGRQMDDYDRNKVGYSIANDQPVAWNNNNTQWRSTPIGTYQASYNGQQTECRDATVDGYVNGRSEQMIVRACRVPGTNGWQIRP